MRGSYTYTDEFDRAIDLLATGQLTVADLTSVVAPLPDTLTAFDALRDGRIMKAFIAPNQLSWAASASADGEPVDCSADLTARPTFEREQDMTDAPQTNIGLVRTLIRAVDNADHHAIAARTATNVRFRFGNGTPTSTQSELLAAAESFRAAIADLRHTVLDIWQVDDDTVIAIMDVSYRRLDGRELNLPCCNLFRVRDGLIDTYSSTWMSTR